MSLEHSDGFGPADSQEHQEIRYAQVSIPDLSPYSQGEPAEIQLEVPEELDLEEAIAEWQYSGGQVRTFSYGANAEMRMKSYSLPDWLMRQKGARPVQDIAEPPVAA